MQGSGVLVSPEMAGTKMVIYGTRGVDVVHVRDGAQVDATKIGLGIDQIYLRGVWADYTKVLVTDVITFSRACAARLAGDQRTGRCIAAG